MAWSKRKEDKSRHTNIPPREVVSSYSYHNVRNTEDGKIGRNIKKIGKKQLKTARIVWLEKFGLIILAAVVIICFISILYLSSNPTVLIVGGSSDPIFTNSRSAVQVTSRKLLSSSVLNSNKITVNARGISATLEADYPEYSDISITLPLINHDPVIYLTPATPAILLQNFNGQYVLNDNGQVIDYSSNASRFSYLKLPLVIDQSGSDISVGNRVLTTQEVVFVQTVVSELSIKNDKVSSMTLPAASSELDLHLVGQQYYVKFNQEENNARVQAGSFLATQHYLTTQNITPSQYIDVRTDGRVYYQ